MRDSLSDRTMPLAKQITALSADAQSSVPSEVVHRLLPAAAMPWRSEVKFGADILWSKSME